MTQTRTALIVSARVDAASRDAVRSGRWPRKDFLELARVLDAEVIDYSTVEAARHWRLLRAVVGMPVTQAWIAYTRRRRYDRIFSDGEHIGIPLALLLRFSRRRIRHVTIGHLLTTPAKRLTFRLLKPHRRLDLILLHATRQHERAHRDLQLRPSQTCLAPYQVDPNFWRPRAAATEEVVIASAGLEYRDYATLVEAVRDLPVRVIISAGSRWSRHSAALVGALPPNVQVVTLDYPALRDLYARSRFVVVPLRPVENQAGITTILEAMAMARAVVVTATAGQRDVVRGRLSTSAGFAAVQGGPAPFGVTGPLAEDETGLYAAPEDPAALRRAIAHLLENPLEAERMGRAGRRLVESAMNLDAFVDRVGGALATAAVALETRMPAVERA